jgi:hypothetical protein
MVAEDNGYIKDANHADIIYRHGLHLLYIRYPQPPSQNIFILDLILCWGVSVLLSGTHVKRHTPAKN